jgi:hypothetical protein
MSRWASDYDAAGRSLYDRIEYLLAAQVCSFTA